MWRDTVRAYLALIAATQDPLHRADMLRALALAFRKRARLRNGRHASRYAIGRAEEALRLTRASGDAVAQAKALDTLASVYHEIGDRCADEAALSRAQGLFVDALGLLDAQDHFEIVAALRHNLAGTHAVRHRIDGQRRHLQAACALYREVRRAALKLRRTVDWARAATNTVRMERDAASGDGGAAALQRAALRLRRILRVLEHNRHAEQAADTRHALAITLTMTTDIVYTVRAAVAPGSPARHRKSGGQGLSRAWRGRGLRTSVLVGWVNPGEGRRRPGADPTFRPGNGVGSAASP